MASSSNIFCGVCDSQHITTLASQWCPECDEGLCQTCLSYHNASKSSRGHEVIPIADYKQLPPSIIDISLYCNEHDRKFQMYCLWHDSPCCPLCVSSTHKKCTGFEAIEKIVKTAKTSTKLESLEETLHAIKKHLTMAIEDFENHLTLTKEQSNRTKIEVTELQNRPNVDIDKLEKNVLDDLFKTDLQIISDLDNSIKMLKNEEQKINNYQTNILAMKRFSSDLQTFLATRIFDEEVLDEQKHIEICVKEMNLKQEESCIKANSLLSYIESRMVGFESTFTKYNASTVNFKAIADNCAQKMTFSTALRNKAFGCIKLTLEKGTTFLEEKQTFISGCDVCPNGDFIFADNYKLVVLPKNEYLKKDISVYPCNPFDVACISDDLVAFSRCGTPEIHILKITTKEILKTIKTDNQCDGITFSEGMLLCCERNTGIRKINLDCHAPSYITKANLPHGSYITAFKNLIYQTIGDTVLCYKNNGDKVWEMKDESLLKSPKGITVDDSYNVYVRDYSEGVVIISADGKEARKILTKENNVHEGNALCYDRQRNQLLVVNFGSGPLLFKVS